MSGDVKINVTRMGVILAAAGAAWLILSGFVHYVGLPDRVSQLEEKQAKMGDVLIRVDENVKILVREQQAAKK